MAPSSYSVRGLRRLADRRGYILHKVRGKDQFWLENEETGHSTVADESRENPYFTQNEVREFLMFEKAHDPEGDRDEDE